MDKILEALSKLLPEDQMKEISEAVKAMVEENKAALEAQFNQNLEEAYADLAAEKAEAEKIAEDSYRRAYDIIIDQDNRIKTMRTEYDEALDEGYEVAFQEVLKERGKNETLEAELYEAYEKKFKEAHDNMVERIHEFMLEKGKEIYENARRDILNDPAMVEHKIVLEKIVENVSDYISDEDRVMATSSKLEEARKAAEESAARVRMLEARCFRLGNDNNKLTEQVNAANKVLSESKKVSLEESKKERVEKAKSATGRGEVTTDKTVKVEAVVAEYAADKTETNSDDANSATLSEQFKPEDIRSMQVLSGLKSDS